MSGVETRLRRIVADHLGISARELGPTVSLREDLAADSLDLVELALRLEYEFTIAVPDRVVERVRSYGDLVDAVVRLLVARGPTTEVPWPPAGSALVPIAVRPSPISRE